MRWAEGAPHEETIVDKGRQPVLAKVPVLLVVGRREREKSTVSVRRLGSQASAKLNTHVLTLGSNRCERGSPPLKPELKPEKGM